MKTRAAAGLSAALGLSCALGAPGTAHAQRAAAAASSPPRTNTERAQPRESTLARLARRLGEELAPPAPPLLIVGPVEVPARPELGDKELAELHERIRLVVGSAVAPVAARGAEPLELTKARELARARRLPLLHLAPRVEGGELVLTVNLVVWAPSFWQRARAPEGTVLSHLVLTAPADAEIRRFLPRPPGLFSKRESYPSPLRDIVALACGALEDEPAALVAVGRHEIVRGRFVGKSFAREVTRPWSSLSPLSAHPLRAPLASARYRADAIEVGSSDRKSSVRLDARLELLERGARAFGLDDGRCAPFSTAGISPADLPCSTPASPTPPPEERGSYAAREAVTLVDEGGLQLAVELTLPADGERARLVVRSPVEADRELELPGVGSAAALADLDGDGRFEVITSSASRGSEDELRVSSFDGQKLVDRFRFRLPPVRALTVCSFFGDDPLAVIAATDDRLWVFR